MKISETLPIASEVRPLCRRPPLSHSRWTSPPPQPSPGFAFCYLQIYICFEDFCERVHQVYMSSSSFRRRVLSLPDSQASYPIFCNFFVINSFEIRCTKASNCKLVIFKYLYSLWRVLSFPSSQVFILSFANLLFVLKSFEIGRAKAFKLNTCHFKVQFSFCSSKF